MLKRISILFSVIAALGLAVAIATPSTVMAKPQQQNKPHVKQQNNIQKKNVVIKKNVTVKYVVGNKYNGHIWYGHSRHRWHGVWYAYGVGPCWINIDGLFFWNVAACP